MFLKGAAVLTSINDLTRKPTHTRRRFVLSLVGLLLITTACGGSQVVVPSTSATPLPAPTTTPQPSATPLPAPTAAAVPSATATSVPAPSATPPPTQEPTLTATDRVGECQRYVRVLGVLLQSTSVYLVDGAAIAGQLADGSLAESDATGQLAAISVALAEVAAQLWDLGDPPDQARPATQLVGESLALFTSAYDLQAQGAAAGDAALIDEGSAELEAGDALLGQLSDVLPDCALAAASDPGPQALATPEEFDLTVFFRTAESLLSATDSPYAGTAPEVLVGSAQASCRALLAGGDIRTALEAAIAESPAAGQPFGSEEQQYVLFVVTRGAALWCPDVITDQDAFIAEVISTIVDVFFDG